PGPVLPSRRHYDLADRESGELTPEALATADAVLIVTHHQAIDWKTVAEHATLVVDTRNAMAPHMPIRGTYVAS
ncbi:MAG: nucleotide sugar dehydrogenase, partial [Planctomycetota bacterium]